jgi:hypothetical protein
MIPSRKDIRYFQFEDALLAVLIVPITLSRINLKIVERFYVTVTWKVLCKSWNMV